MSAKDCVEVTGGLIIRISGKISVTVNEVGWKIWEEEGSAVFGCKMGTEDSEIRPSVFTIFDEDNEEQVWTRQREAGKIELQKRTNRIIYIYILKIIVKLLNFIGACTHNL